MKKISAIILLFLSGACVSFGAREVTHGTTVFSSRDLGFHNVVIAKEQGTEIFRLNDTTYEKNADPFITDMILSFNSSTVSTIDDTRRYRIRASYDPVQIPGTTGSGAALFYRQSDGVEIQGRENLWLSSRSDLGSFTIEMRANLLAVKEGAVLFSRIGYASGVKNGIEIRIEKKRICAYLYGIFPHPDGDRKTYSLTRGMQIKENQWVHYALSFDRLTGKLAQFVDGQEADAIFATESGKPCEGVLAPSFAAGDMPKTFLAKGFHGYLDEVKISYRHYEDLRRVSDSAEKRYRDLRMSGRIPINKEGVIVSSVGEFSYTGSMVTLFAWDELVESGSFVWFEFRISDIKFSSDDSRLKWYRITNNQRNIYQQKTPDGFLRGKYYQWRAHLIPSPEGKSAPMVKNIRMDYELDIAPEVPFFVKAESGDSSITISWKKNVDFDLAGYKIYYGVRPGVYDGVIRRIGGRPITNDLSKTNTVSVRIDQSVIEENRMIDSGSVLEYPVIKNNILYYFAVSAYDSYKVDTQFNHESRASLEVSARPFPGSEIR
jgi:hypothetical protein